MAKRHRITPAGGRQPRERPVPMINAPSQRLQAAHSLWNEGRQRDALDLYAEAIRQEPNNVQTYVQAARAHAEIYDFDGLNQTHEKLVRRAPHHPGVHHFIGETFDLLKLPARAIASYERAAQLPGAGPVTWIELASLYERAHRLDEAEELTERTVRAGFNLPIVSLVRGRIQRRQNRFEQAEATFQSLIERFPEDSQWACLAWSELALMKDRQGDFNGASDAIVRCKRVQKAHEAPFWCASEKVHDQMRELIAAIARDDFRSWHDAMRHQNEERVALLTGFPRSGTTLLEQVLDAHHDLASSEERDFIGRELFYEITAHRGKLPLIDVLKNYASNKFARSVRGIFGRWNICWASLSAAGCTWTRTPRTI